jgi:hypothetical protein
MLEALGLAQTLRGTRRKSWSGMRAAKAEAYQATSCGRAKFESRSSTNLTPGCDVNVAVLTGKLPHDGRDGGDPEDRGRQGVGFGGRSLIQHSSSALGAPALFPAIVQPQGASQ